MRHIHPYFFAIELFRFFAIPFPLLFLWLFFSSFFSPFFFLPSFFPSFISSFLPSCFPLKKDEISTTAGSNNYKLRSVYARAHTIPRGLIKKNLALVYNLSTCSKKSIPRSIEKINTVSESHRIHD